MFISEKFDGLRAIWDGNCFYSRTGKLFAFPKFFTEGFPNCLLDGELFAGRGNFDQASGFVRKKVPIDDEWK